jgi:hypothetical protein
VSFLFVKLVIEVQTVENVYQIKQGFLYKLRFLSDSEMPFLVRGHILLIPFRFELDKIGGSRKKKKPKKRRKRTLATFKTGALKTVLNAFRLKYFHLILDTDNPIINANLIVPAQMISNIFGENYSVGINFSGNNSLAARLELKPFRLLRILKLSRNK